MPEPETITTTDLTAWTRENPPPEDITVIMKYAAADPATFHFKNSILAYDHFIKETYGDENAPGPVAVAEAFLIDTVHADQRDPLSAFLATNPGRAVMLSLYRVVNSLLDIYNDHVTVEIKNTSP